MHVIKNPGPEHTGYRIPLRDVELRVMTACGGAELFGDIPNYLARYVTVGTPEELAAMNRENDILKAQLEGRSL